MTGGDLCQKTQPLGSSPPELPQDPDRNQIGRRSLTANHGNSARSSHQFVSPGALMVTCESQIGGAVGVRSGFVGVGWGLALVVLGTQAWQA